MSGFRVRELSGLAEEQLTRLISSREGGDRDGSNEVFADGEDKPV